MTTAFVITIVVVLFLICAFIKALWNSPIFWVVAFMAAAALMPFTAGMSPLALIGLIVLRVFLIDRIFKSGF